MNMDLKSIQVNASKILLRMTKRINDKRTILNVSAILNVSISAEKWLLTVPFSETKCCGVVPFFYMKIR